MVETCLQKRLHPKLVADQAAADKPTSTVIEPKIEGGNNESMIEVGGCNKRGKKAQSLEEYKEHVLGKIDELVKLIKDPSTSLEDRKKYRN